VVATGPRIQVYVDRATNPAIDVQDNAAASGRFGVNVFDGLAEFQDVTVR
jgi:fructan beta-fructosidase